MKKLVAFLLLIVVGIAIYWFFVREENKTESVEPVPLAITANSDAFNTSFAKMMQVYYNLKNSFADWDTTKINQFTTALRNEAEKLPLNELKADSSVVQTAQMQVQVITGDAAGIVGESTIEEKRKSFHTLSEALYDLIRTVRYDGEVVYHQRCDMAFDGEQTAFWLSNKKEIVNPYLGNKHPKYKDKMFDCGEVNDSLDFRKK